MKDSGRFSPHAHIKAITHCPTLSNPCRRYWLQCLSCRVKVAGNNGSFLYQAYRCCFIVCQQMNFLKLNFRLCPHFHFFPPPLEKDTPAPSPPPRPSAPPSPRET